MVYVCAMVATLSLAYLAWGFTARSAYESAEYSVLHRDGAFEVREYPDLMLATTSMSLSAQGEDGSFGRLFRYISGENVREQKVAMTTPVFMEGSEDGRQGRMGFVMPKAVAKQCVPAPRSDRVAIEERRGGRFAVIRFSGRTTARRLRVRRRTCGFG